MSPRERTEPVYQIPIVGRVEEISELLSLLEKALRSPQKLVLVEGEAGVGKTRLIEELYPRAIELQFDILESRCSILRRNDPYGVFIEALEKELNTGEVPRDKVPLLEFFEIDKSSGGEEKEWRADILRHQSRMFELTSQLLIQMSSEKPIFIFLDDLHNADAQSLKLLHYVVKSLRSSPVFIIGAYRPEELEAEGVHPLTDMIQRMSRERLIDIITLARLSRDEVKQMIVNTFPMHGFSDDFINRIHEESEGNPLFIKELLKTMVEEGVVFNKNDEWHVVESYELLEIPATIRDIISRRILRLGSEAIDALRWASVIGDEFSFELLADVTETEEDELFDVIDELLQDKLIIEGAGDELFRFTHNKIREVTYETFTRGKPEMHYKVAMSLEKLTPPRLMNGAYDLAYHFSFTEDNEKIVHYSMLAGKKAMGTYALNEAFTYYKKAMEALKHLEYNEENQRKKLEILLNFGDIHIGLGEMEDALGYYEDVIKMCEELRDERKMERAYRKMVEVYGRRGDYDSSTKYLNMALKIAERNDYLDSLMRIHYKLGFIRVRKSKYEEAIEFYNKSLEYAERIGNYSDIGAAYFAFAELHRGLRNYNKALENAIRALENWEKIRDFRLPYLYNTLGGISLLGGNPQEAISHYEKAIECSRNTGDIYVRGYALSGIAQSYLELHNLDIVLNNISNALEIFNRMNTKDMIADSYRILGVVFKYKKDWNESEKFFRKSIEIFEKLNMPFYIGEANFDFALMYKEKGLKNERDIYLNKALEIFKKINNKSWIEKVEKELNKIIIK